MKSYTPPPDLLRERVILVTGAGQGIGRAAAHAFAAHGATVILHGRREKKLDAVYDEIREAGLPEPVVLPLDLEKAADAEFAAMREAIENQLGRLDGILHNAVERYTPGGLDSQKLEAWTAACRVNLIAPAALNRALAPLLMAAQDASVIVTSDEHARRPKAYWGRLAVTKAALEALVRIQADEWEAQPGLRINAVVPGAVRAPQRLTTHPGLPPDALAAPESLMPVYLYLMGSDSRGVTGQVVECGEA